MSTFFSNIPELFVARNKKRVSDSEIRKSYWWLSSYVRDLCIDSASENTFRFDENTGVYLKVDRRHLKQISLKFIRLRFCYWFQKILFLVLHTCSDLVSFFFRIWVNVNGVLKTTNRLKIKEDTDIFNSSQVSLLATR